MQQSVVEHLLLPLLEYALSLLGQRQPVVLPAEPLPPPLVFEQLFVPFLALVYEPLLLAYEPLQRKPPPLHVPQQPLVGLLHQPLHVQPPLQFDVHSLPLQPVSMPLSLPLLAAVSSPLSPPHELNFYFRYSVGPLPRQPVVLQQPLLMPPLDSSAGLLLPLQPHEMPLPQHEQPLVLPHGQPLVQLVLPVLSPIPLEGVQPLHSDFHGFVLGLQ